MQHGASHTLQVLLEFFLTERGARTILASDYRAPSKPLLLELGILYIYSLRFRSLVGSFMHMYHHGLIPSFLFLKLTSNWKLLS